MNAWYKSSYLMLDVAGFHLYVQKSENGFHSYMYMQLLPEYHKCCFSGKQHRCREIPFFNLNCICSKHHNYLNQSLGQLFQTKPLIYGAKWYEMCTFIELCAVLVCEFRWQLGTVAVYICGCQNAVNHYLFCSAFSDS